MVPFPLWKKSHPPPPSDEFPPTTYLRAAISLPFQNCSGGGRSLEHIVNAVLTIHGLLHVIQLHAVHLMAVLANPLVHALTVSRGKTRRFRRGVGGNGDENRHGAEARAATTTKARITGGVGRGVAESSHVDVEDIRVHLSTKSEHVRASEVGQPADLFTRSGNENSKGVHPRYLP